MTSRRRFDASVEAVGAARKFVDESIADAATDIRDSVSLMVSELATNALLHAASGFDVSVVRSGPSLLVTVSDHGDEGMPRMQAPRSSEPHGRGLRVVDALSEEWGVSTTEDDGKTVWFRIRLQPSTSDSSTSGDPDAATFDLVGQVEPTPDGSIIVATDSASDAPKSLRRGIGPQVRARTSGTTVRRRRARSTH
jgi:anti-sigma regulatory factor (Ser/Thr protein kinase)